MDLFSVALILFSCVAANHLELVATIEKIVGHELPVINCPKCLTFWSVVIYGVAEADSSLFTLHSSLTIVAVAFLSAYLAIWLELLMFSIDTLYNRIYDKLYKENEDSAEER